MSIGIFPKRYTPIETPIKEKIAINRSYSPPVFRSITIEPVGNTIQ